MMPRTEYEMTEADLAEIMDAIKPQPYMVMGGHAPRSQQERANDAWKALGRKMGFDSTTVRPVAGKGERFFSAVPNETAEAKNERLAREAAEKAEARAAELESQIASAQVELDSIRNSAP